MGISTTSINGLIGGRVYNSDRVFRKNKETPDTFAEQVEKVAEKKDQYVPTSLPDTRPSVPDSLIHDLAEKYDPKNMTQEEYRAFLDDLVSADVIQESDKIDLRYDPNTILVDLGEKGFRMRKITPIESQYYANGYYNNLEQAGGNALRWAESWKVYYGDAEDYIGHVMHRPLLLFEEIASILDRMAEVE